MKNKGYRIAFDSDGCVMDSMRIKHEQAFGPCLIHEWGLERWQAEVLAQWRRINLDSLTRGVNRFCGLAMALAWVDRHLTRIEGLAALQAFVHKCDELSAAALGRARQSVCTEKALRWSEAVDRALSALPAMKPFPHAAKALAAAGACAEVSVVSAATRQAVMSEWTENALIGYADAVLTQEDGGKSACLSQLTQDGMAKERVLMCGDAPGDERAARENGIFFFPIMVGQEEVCWQAFIREGLPRFLAGEYAAYGQECIALFYENLGGEEW